MKSQPRSKYAETGGGSSATDSLRSIPRSGGWIGYVGNLTGECQHASISRFFLAVLGVR